MAKVSYDYHVVSPDACHEDVNINVLPQCYCA